MLEKLLDLDTKIFLLINGFHSESFDGIMWWISGKTTWWPFYLLILIYLTWEKRYLMIPIIVGIALAITMADQISVHLFKEVFERLRPCKEPALDGLVHLVHGKCGGKFGFVSSHAANTFAVAFFLLMVARKWWYTLIMLFWAALVGYSRIYLGVHYPGDVLGGALLGVACGGIVYLCYGWLLPRIPISWSKNIQ